MIGVGFAKRLNEFSWQPLNLHAYSNAAVVNIRAMKDVLAAAVYSGQLWLKKCQYNITDIELE